MKSVSPGSTITREPQFTKFQLFSILATKGSAFITIDGETCILLGVTRESGSGNSFILEYYSNGTKQTKCVRTID